MLRDDLYSEVIKTHAFEYFWCMAERPSVIDVAQLMPFKFECYALHPLQAEDRLGNPDIDFPIAMAFGDRDKFGSDGAETIIRNNKQFKTGRSQLFRVSDCEHPMMFDQPFELARLMVGFFNGTIKGKFERKPRNEQVIPANYKQFEKGDSMPWKQVLVVFIVCVMIAYVTAVNL